jgi:ABC-type glycerol-3-phosphate transport system substrate-binding protein
MAKAWLARLPGVLVALAAAGILSSWFAFGPREEVPAGATVVECWHPWGGTSTADFDAAIREFNRSHPAIHARTLFVTNDLANSQKVYISVAGGVAPDVTFVDGPQVAEWAQRGILEPLDDLIAEAGIKPDDFWPPCWRQNLYGGHVYALTYGADPNFGFFWNKQVFEDAGLDPERPPRTFEEMDAFARRITSLEDGRLTRVGLIPWAVYGNANSMFTWGWAFGGEFYDPATQAITADDLRNVAALDWVCSYAKQYDITKVSGLQSTFGTAEQNPFIVGKLGMMPMVIGEVRNLRRFAPDLRYGVAPLPTPPGGIENSSWVGGWCMGIPRGARGDRRAGFELMRWLCATPEGTRFVYRSTGSFPGYRNSPVYEELAKDPVMAVFYRILKDCKHQRPVMPAQAYYMGELERAVSSALYGGVSPAEALARARERTQKHLDRMLGKASSGAAAAR